MEVQAPFGIVTGCHACDRHFVQATLASIRHYMPDIPICLVQDGDFDLRGLEDRYSLTILRPQELPNPDMRQLTSGNYRAKMAAMWEGPFERFVWIDSDAIVWGDFRPQLDLAVDFQIFWSEISIPDDATEVPSWLPHFYFDPARLHAFDAEFNWRGLPYFCTGAFLSRRNAIAFDTWMNAEQWLRSDPGLFSWGEMGMLNYLVHSLSQQGRISTSMADLQHIWGHHGCVELIADCRNAGWRFPNEIKRPRVAHFCGRKPLLFDSKAYSRPFTIARLAHYRQTQCSPVAWLSMISEDCHVLISKIQRKMGLP